MKRKIKATAVVVVATTAMFGSTGCSLLQSKHQLAWNNCVDKVLQQDGVGLLDNSLPNTVGDDAFAQCGAGTGATYGGLTFDLRDPNG